MPQAEIPKGEAIRPFRSAGAVIGEVVELVVELVGGALAYDPTMEPVAYFLVGTGLAAAVDWWAVALERRAVEMWAKPITMALLVGVAATAGDQSTDVRAALVIGAVFGLAGDIALLGKGEASFMAGLAAFAVGHLAYVVAAVSIGFDPLWALVGVVFVIGLLGYRFVGQIVPGARDHGGPVLAGAVTFYALVISAMVVTSWATAAWVAGVGAMLFAVSDWLIGYQRFVAKLPNGGVAVIVPYHVGQALLIIGLATA